MLPQVSLKDYDGLNGFGASSMNDVNELTKALSAGYQTSGQTGGSALRVESLESSLKVVTFTNKHIKLWKKIPKSAAYSTVEEYNVLSSYGSAGFGFTREGEIPQSQDSTYTRQTALVKFIGTTRSVTHPATLVNPAHGDVIALENQNGILWLLERTEDALFHGNSSLAFDGESEQFDGLDSLISSGNVIDLEGQPLQEADIEEAANQVIESFGYPTDMYLGTRAMSDLVKTFYPRERINLPAPADGQVGLAVNSMATQAGNIEFNPNVFIKQAKSPPSAATSVNAPATPKAFASLTVGSAATASWSKLLGTPSGDNNFAYAVTAANRFGESAPVLSSAVAVSAVQAAANNPVTFNITNADAIGANPPEYYIVYRTNSLGTSTTVPTSVSSFSEIARVRCTSQAAGGAGASVVDNNVNLPFTETAYLGELTPSVLTFRQLAPLMRMDLAVLAPAYRWMILMYGTPILFAPAKWTRLINVGRIS